MMFFWIAYLIVLCLNIHKYIRYIFTPIFVILLFIFTLLNESCYILFGVQINTDIASIIGGTNPNEIVEFLQSYISLPFALILVIISITLFAFYFISTYRPIKISTKFVSFLTIILIVSIFSSIHNPGVLYSIKNENRWDFQFDQVVDLTKHHSIFQTEETNKSHPAKVVVIIGESHSKSHSQLYGYKLQNQPRLSIMHANGDLLVFNNVKSPATYTTEAFKYILNTHLVKNKNNKNKWYDSVNIIEVFKKLGYKTRWISNQQSVGMWDNIASGFSKLCDIQHFSEDSNESLDEYCLKHVKIDANSRVKSLSIYHLMGQHEDFAERYPPRYDVFKEELYQKYPEEQRKDRAHYDNATLYNDFIVSSIFNSYCNTDAVCLYFPDHGLDLYESSYDFRGHARLGNQNSIEASLRIPLYVYLTPAFRKKNSNLEKMAILRQNDPFTTDNIIHFVLELSGYKLSY